MSTAPPDSRRPTRLCPAVEVIWRRGGGRPHASRVFPVVTQPVAALRTYSFGQVHARRRSCRVPLATFHGSRRVALSRLNVFPKDAPGVLNGAPDCLLVGIIHNGNTTPKQIFKPMPGDTKSRTLATSAAEARLLSRPCSLTSTGPRPTFFGHARTSDIRE
jgi:hypothetical protein